MSQTSKMNIASGVTGAGLTTLPQTGSNVSNVLPIIGFIMLSVVIAFSLYNYGLKKWFKL